ASPDAGTVVRRDEHRALFLLGSGAEKAADGIRDVLSLLFRQLGEDRKRQYLAARLLGLWKLPFAVTEIGEALLQVEGERVVDRRAHATFAQVGDKRVTPSVEHADRVLVVNRFVLGSHGRGVDAVESSKGLVV